MKKKLLILLFSISVGSLLSMVKNNTDKKITFRILSNYASDIELNPNESRKIGEVLAINATKPLKLQAWFDTKKRNSIDVTDTLKKYFVTTKNYTIDINEGTNTEIPKIELPDINLKVESTKALTDCKPCENELKEAINKIKSLDEQLNQLRKLLNIEEIVS